VYLWHDISVPHSNKDAGIEEQPLRAELFSTDQLVRHAKALAAWHELNPRF
jgi:hypothetical protein